jgi:hypothetical protein
MGGSSIFLPSFENDNQQRHRQFSRTFEIAEKYLGWWAFGQ